MIHLKQITHTKVGKVKQKAHTFFLHLFVEDSHLQSFSCVHVFSQVSASQAIRSYWGILRTPISWIYPLPRMPVTNRIIPFLIGNPYKPSNRPNKNRIMGANYCLIPPISNHHYCWSKKSFTTWNAQDLNNLWTGTINQYNLSSVCRPPCKGVDFNEHVTHLQSSSSPFRLREAKQVNLSLVSRFGGYTCHLGVEIYHVYISLLVCSVNLGMFLLMQL